MGDGHSARPTPAAEYAARQDSGNADCAASNSPGCRGRAGSSAAAVNTDSWTFTAFTD